MSQKVSVAFKNKQRLRPTVANHLLGSDGLLPNKLREAKIRILFEYRPSTKSFTS